MKRVSIDAANTISSDYICSSAEKVSSSEKKGSTVFPSKGVALTLFGQLGAENPTSTENTRKCCNKIANFFTRVLCTLSVPSEVRTPHHKVCGVVFWCFETNVALRGSIHQKRSTLTRHLL